MSWGPNNDKEFPAYLNRGIILCLLGYRMEIAEVWHTARYFTSHQ